MAHKPDMIIVDDHETFRKGIIYLITIENIASVIGEASNGHDFIKLLSRLKPDLVLMDIAMPGMDGIEATRKALELMPDLKVIAFTMFGNDEYVDKMISLGVKGFILKSGGIEELEKAIQQAMTGKTYFSKDIIRNSNNKKLNCLFKHKQG